METAKDRLVRWLEQLAVVSTQEARFPTSNDLPGYDNLSKIRKYVDFDAKIKSHLQISLIRNGIRRDLHFGLPEGQ